MDSQRILRLWAAAAWADNELHPAEAAALQRFIEASDDLSADQRRDAKQVLAGPPSVALEEVKQLSAEAREGVYRAAHGIVRLDRKVTDDERAFLVRLRAQLDLDEAAIQRIEAEVDR